MLTKYSREWYKMDSTSYNLKIQIHVKLFKILYYLNFFLKKRGSLKPIG